uniref:HECT-type E3 ubiquitin transferase n=1 Tax=Penicillium janthinellum TaxID=5079 RepID=A0A0E3D8L7_PENJA|nr:putative ubiquitin protein ligase [Penicillium janthinellum]
MPSRPGRDPPLPPLPPILSPGVTAPPSNLPRLPPRAPASEITRKRLPERQNAPTMATMNGSAPISPRRGHHRSISHPFPFPGLGKRRDKGKANMWESDSDSDEVTFPADTVDGSPRKDSNGGGDLSEAKCQTCNSTVRWPRNLTTFRCSACLTVTDLDPEPLTEPQTSVKLDTEDRTQGGRSKKHPFDDRPLPPLPPSARPPEQRPEMPLSARYMSDLIDRCLSIYFDAFLDGPRSTLGPDDNRSGRARPSQPEEIPSAARGPGGHLSAPRDPRDPRNRSTSGSGERLGVPKHKSTFLKPHVAQWGGKGTPVRTRANSDLQSSPEIDPYLQGRPAHHSDLENQDRDSHRRVFERLENYLIAALKGIDILNTSFSTHQPSIRSASSGNPPRMKMDSNALVEPTLNAAVFEPDAKTLLLGDLAENSSWWMTEWAQAEGHMPSLPREKGSQDSRLASSRSPRINWAEVARWYQLLLTAGSSWAERWVAKRPEYPRSEADTVRQKRWESADLAQLEREIIDSRLHLQRTFMKAVENLLKRPRRLIKKPDDTRWLFILLANPLLSSPSAYLPPRPVQASYPDSRRPSHPSDGPRLTTRDGKSSHKDHSHGGSNRHHGIVKRIFGLMSNASNECHHYFISWFSRLSPSQFERIVELAGGFVTYRLTRQHGRKRSEISKDGDELIPSFASAAGNTPAELHAAINNRRNPNKKSEKKKEAPMVYVEDWQIKAGSRVLSLLFIANTDGSRKSDVHLRDPRSQRHPNSAGQSGRRDNYMVPISAFYNTLLDYSDLIADFEVWESKSSKFSFCQYPFLLSIWAKIRIMEHDARRQMEVKAREAFFSSILTQRAVSQYLVLKVRRECLVEDSMRAVGESVGAGSEEIKKGLRIEFVGEEGVDAGGLRKEWFLLLVREVFDPNHGLFIYDDDSQYCYFNPYCFESSEQFYLVGVLLGLAIYNSTILDVDLPPFAFRKLLAAAPQNTGSHPPNPHTSRFKCTLDDLAEFRPALAKGLRGLLEFEGDVAETFCYDFVAQVDRYGEVVTVPLCTGGEKRAVTNSNRREFVDLYVRYLLDTAVARQFEPFKRGFFTVCGCNSLSLFRSEEIELLVRGSDEPLDVTSLRAVATYDNWSNQRPEASAVVQWFWDFFERAQPQAQRKILSFVTGSDRIPAMGATSLSIRLACLGDDCSRYPIARTCFNTLGLYRYGSREKLEKLLWDAVVNSEGFGLK